MSSGEGMSNVVKGALWGVIISIALVFYFRWWKVTFPLTAIFVLLIYMGNEAQEQHNAKFIVVAEAKAADYLNSIQLVNVGYDPYDNYATLEIRNMHSTKDLSFVSASCRGKDHSGRISGTATGRAYRSKGSGTRISNDTLTPPGETGYYVMKMEWPENLAVGDIPGGPRVECNISGVLFGEDIQLKGADAEVSDAVAFRIMKSKQYESYPDFVVTNRSSSTITDIEFLCQWRYKDGPTWSYTEAMRMDSFRQEYQKEGMEIKSGETVKLINNERDAYRRKYGSESEHRCRIADVSYQ